MTSPEMKKAPAATGAIKNRSTNYQKEETMNTIIPEATVNQQATKFDTTIHVAGLTIAPVNLSGDMTVAIDYDGELPGELLAFTPHQACALAAALQTVAVHLLEEEPRHITRHTEPGNPSFEEAI